MSKVADLHQEYLDYLEANRCPPDAENGPSPDDVDNVPMTFDEFVEYKKQKAQSEQWRKEGKCECCGKVLTEKDQKCPWNGTCFRCFNDCMTVADDVN